MCKTNPTHPTETDLLPCSCCRLPCNLSVNFRSCSSVRLRRLVPYVLCRSILTYIHTYMPFWE